MLIGVRHRERLLTLGDRGDVLLGYTPPCRLGERPSRVNLGPF